MTCKQTQQRPPSSETIMRRTQNNIMSFTVNTNQLSHVTTSMRDYKNLRMSLKTRIKIWISRFRASRTERHNVS